MSSGHCHHARHSPPPLRATTGLVLAKVSGGLVNLQTLALMRDRFVSKHTFACGMAGVGGTSL